MESKNCPKKFGMNIEWYKYLNACGIEFELLICDEAQCAWWTGTGCSLAKKENE